METETKIIEVCPWCANEVEVVIAPGKLEDAARGYLHVTCPKCKLEF